MTYWPPGVEFFPGLGEYTGGRRMLLAGGKNNFPRGLENFTIEGERIFLNAVDYMLAEPRLKVVFSGYDQSETLTNIPLLVRILSVVFLNFQATHHLLSPEMKLWKR